MKISEHWDTEMSPQSFREENVSHTMDQEPDMASDFSTITVEVWPVKSLFKFTGEIKTFYLCDFSKNIPLVYPFSGCHRNN